MNDIKSYKTIPFRLGLLRSFLDNPMLEMEAGLFCYAFLVLKRPDLFIEKDDLSESSLQRFQWRRFRGISITEKDIRDVQDFLDTFQYPWSYPKSQTVRAILKNRDYMKSAAWRIEWEMGREFLKDGFPQSGKKIGAALMLMERFRRLMKRESGFRIRDVQLRLHVNAETARWLIDSEEKNGHLRRLSFASGSSWFIRIASPPRLAIQSRQGRKEGIAMDNTLYYGDNLDVMKRHIADESVDLVYLDPPFKSDQNYNVLFKEKDGSEAASQIRAFEDTWTWGQDDEAVFADLVTKGGKVADCLQAFRTFMGPCDMLSYLVMMAPRLVELRRVMKPTASIYLHCDPTASHYLKMLMDAIFDPRNFRREVIWRSGWVSGFKSAAKNWIRNHDVILFYLRDIKSDFVFKIPFIPHPPGYKRRGGTGSNPLGVPIDDVWLDIYSPAIMSFSREKLGYPTQKPLALLERIIQASSNEGDLVLDPFCGCGTTITAAEKLKRRWIGIDITHLAVALMKTRLADAFGNKVIYKVIGEPTSLTGAAELAASDPYQFQWWALGLVGARPVDEKKGADKGIDGKIIFQGDDVGKFEQVIISVKAGHTGRDHVHSLGGVINREKAAIGVLITMNDLTGPMKEEAVTAGFFESKTWGKKYPKIQLLTIADLLSGKKIDMPPIKQVDATFQKAKRYQVEEGKQLEFKKPEKE